MQSVSTDVYMYMRHIDYCIGLLLIHVHCRFQFDDPNLPTSHFNLDSVPISITDSGRCHGLVVWWDIDLGGSLLTMDPWDYGQWRDHWLQGVFLWPLPLTVSKGVCLEVVDQSIHTYVYLLTRVPIGWTNGSGVVAITVFEPVP